MNRRKEKSLSDIACHWWSLIIPTGSHGQHICSVFAARMWWAEAAYPLITLLSALFIHLLPVLSCAKEIFVFETFIDKMCFFFVSFFLQNKVLCVHKALPHHYFSLSMLLYQTMTSAGNCFQTRQGPGFHFFYFPFLSAGPSHSESIRSR